MATITLFLVIVAIYGSALFALLGASKEREQDAMRAYEALKQEHE